MDPRYVELKKVLTPEQFSKFEDLTGAGGLREEELADLDGQDLEGVVDSLLALDIDSADMDIIFEMAEDQDFYSLEELADDFVEEGNQDNSFRIGDRFEGFRSLEAAETAAVQYAREIFDEMPDMIAYGIEKGWMLDFIDEDRAKRFFEQVYNEWNYSYAEDIQDESPSDDEFENRLEEEMAERGVDNMDDFVEAMTEDNLGSDGGFSYYSDNFGEEAASKLLESENLIDLDAAAEYVVRSDGWAHGISHYDGEYSELPSGAVYYRAN